ncbi:CHRD domain-containing protein [Azohydromonas caseinilytica]|uniref:CHRD domain-containing protein n=1 Tax=Azohydromonas caseinilytica TaxID=2728836 RepID=A0A848FKU5_9BURK|nr:CHRD domain-containing protein [Azohydromonas caseinilytica]NML18421.1 CHRD domain-containing protein [Azohydromonas caseinilytica]
MKYPSPPVAAALLGCALSLPALGHEEDHAHGTAADVQARLNGFQEVPSVSTFARATFNADVDRGAKLITWQLRYDALEGEVQQAHLHFAQRGVNGGIVVFLCSNLDNGPAGTPLCPGPHSGMLSGSITPNDVSPDIAATQPAITQGIAPGQFNEMVRALNAGALYVNVHSTRWPTGEVRAQLQPGR